MWKSSTDLFLSLWKKAEAACSCYCSSVLDLYLPFSHTPGTALTAFHQKESLYQVSSPLAKCCKGNSPSKGWGCSCILRSTGSAGMAKQVRWLKDQHWENSLAFCGVPNLGWELSVWGEGHYLAIFKTLTCVSLKWSISNLESGCQVGKKCSYTFYYE